MGDVAYNLYQEPDKTVEIVVHIDETLGQERRKDLVNALESTGGIQAAEFCPLRFHLMLVRYNRELMSSQDVLGKVNAENVHAKLIGPV